MGRNSASVAELGITLLESTNENAISQVYCTECDYSGIEYANQLGYIFNIEKSEASSTQKWLDNLEVPCRQKCNECFYKLAHQIYFKEAPEILVLEYCIISFNSSVTRLFCNFEKFQKNQKNLKKSRVTKIGCDA